LLGRRFVGWFTGGLVVVLAFAAFGLFQYLPSELVPEEDRGRVDINISGPEGAGYDYTFEAAQKIEARLMELYEEGTVSRYLISMPRFGSTQFNTGSANVNVAEGPDAMDSNALAAQLNKEFSGITAVRATAFVRPALRGTEGNSVDLVAIGADYDQIAAWLRPIQAAAENNPGLTRVRVDYEPTSPRLLVTINREQAAALGVSTQAVGRALETMFGSRRVTTYIREGREYDVILQTDREQRESQEDLNNLYVRSESGAVIPLASVVTTEVRGDTPDRERTDRSRSVDLTAQLNPGYTIGEAIAFFEAEVAKQPGGVSVLWGGGARDYLEAGDAVGLAFAMALLLVFLVLAAQFESWIHPGVIMLTVPVAAVGGLFGLLVADSTINTYSQIGLIILVGIAAKNGILIVEFANQLRDQGLSIREAVIEASTLRLRPIIMTSISAAAGSVPLIVWGGAGGEARQTIGVVIFFGAIFATLLTLFIVPIFYNLLARFTKSPDHMARRIDAFEEAEQARVANAAE
jgi:multidrug efflux pump